jgi:hypothetical protein
MNRTTSALMSHLSYGVTKTANKDYSHGFVETLAKAYEKARNSLEYRADNLVRRAAIERILKRLIVIYKSPHEVAENLLNELKWARYLDTKDVGEQKVEAVTELLTKYITYSGTIPHEWIAKIASAELEELFNLNKDYSLFTFFAFQVIKQKVTLKDDNLDLLIYTAVDKVYAGSDPEQIAYHIISLAKNPLDKAKMEDGWALFKVASKNKNLPRLNKFVRRNMPPLVLLRDMYFYSPDEFKKSVTDKQTFLKYADEVLTTQLEQMSTKISRARMRSIIYIFLTKMLIAYGVEAPLETLIYRELSILPLLTNLIFPPLLMLAATLKINIPAENEQKKLIERVHYILENFDDIKNEADKLEGEKGHSSDNLTYTVFSGLYIVIFSSIFILIYYVLGILGFKFFSKAIFIFFLTIIAFFAYRINQITKEYSWREKQEATTFGDMFSLPILTIGSKLSQGLTKINFIGFLFDFILEAPFKIILGFLDDWVQFLSAKKEQQVLD